MVTIKTHKTTIIIILLLISFLLNLYIYSLYKKLDNKYQSLERESMVTSWSKSNSVYNGYIEIFDVKEERVVKSVLSNDKIRNEVEKYLKEITSIYVKIKPIPNNGFIIKIPLYPPIDIDNEFFNYQISIVYLMFPENESPYLMIFDKESHPFFYNFSGNTDLLLKYLNYK